VFSKTDVANADEDGVLGIKEIKVIEESVVRVQERGQLHNVSVDHLTQLLALMENHVGVCENKQLG
jgi:hypothetical protein